MHPGVTSFYLITFLHPIYVSNIQSFQQGISVIKTFFGPKDILDENFFGPKDILDQKSFSTNNHFGPKTILDQKSFWTKNYLGPKMLWITNSMTPRKSLDPICSLISHCFGRTHPLFEPKSF